MEQFPRCLPVQCDPNRTEWTKLRAAHQPSHYFKGNFCPQIATEAASTFLATSGGGDDAFSSADKHLIHEEEWDREKASGSVSWAAGGLWELSWLLLLVLPLAQLTATTAGAIVGCPLLFHFKL